MPECDKNYEQSFCEAVTSHSMNQIAREPILKQEQPMKVLEGKYSEKMKPWTLWGTAFVFLPFP